MRLTDACTYGWVHHQRILDLGVRIDGDCGTSIIARVVCMPFGGQDRYYLTTLPRSIFTPHDVVELYRVRWEVERFFRGWKGALRLDEVRRLQNAKSLDAAVTASLLAAALAHDLTVIVNDLAEQQAAAERAAIPPLRRRQVRSSHRSSLARRSGHSLPSRCSSGAHFPH